MYLEGPTADLLPIQERVQGGAATSDADANVSTAAAVAADFNNDKLVDLYVANALGQPNALYINSRAGFIKAAADVAQTTADTRAVVAADLDGDESLYLICTLGRGAARTLCC